MLGGSGFGGSGSGGGMLGQAREVFAQNPRLAGGGIGALAGMLMGRGQPIGGLMGGATLGILGAIAARALQTDRGGPAAQPSGSAANVSASPSASADEDTALLNIRSMIAAAKCDGEIDQGELEQIMGKLTEAGLGDEERRWVLDEMRRDIPPEDIARQVPDQTTAAQVYAAALFAIEVDSDAERAYLRRFATLLGLSPTVVQSLHEQLDAKPPAATASPASS